MRLLFIAIILIAPYWVQAQSWAGYNTSIYGGVQSLQYQPALHTVMPSDWDINVLSTNLTFFNENFFGSWDNARDIQVGEINGIGDIYNNRNGFINATIQFPSVAFRINPKSTVGFSWIGRGVLISGVSSESFSSLLSKISDPDIENISFSDEFATGLLITWSEFNFFYSRHLFNKNGHLLSGGISFKILSGNASAYMDLGSLSFNYSDGTLSDLDLSFNMAMNSTVDELADGEEINLASRIGIGTDLGLVYEIDAKNKNWQGYLVKLGISLTGLGKINYGSSSEMRRSNLHIDNVSIESFKDITTPSQLMDTLQSVLEFDSEKSENLITRLPLAFRISGDYRLGDKYYIHVAYSRAVYYFGTEKMNDISYNQIYIVPRFETKNIGLYLPFKYNKFIDLQSGIAFRWKPLVIGSGNIISYMFQGEKRTTLDIYFTTRIKINQKK